VGRHRDGDRAPALGFADLGVFGFGPAARQALIENPEFTMGGNEMREADLTYCIPTLTATYPTTLLRTQDPRQLIAVNTPEDLVNAERALHDEDA
jgi:hypothetical protein